MALMKRHLYTWQLYFFLLPVFFIFHGFTANLGLVPVADCLLLLTVYCASMIVLYLVINLYLKNHIKSCLFIAFVISFYFFFGAIDDWLKTHVVFFSKYSVILPLFFVAAVFLLIYLKKTNHSFLRFRFFLNVLLLLYLFIDVAGLLWKKKYSNKDELAVYGLQGDNLFLPCADCKNPDIYFLLFDEYSSSPNLQQTFHYNNIALDSALNRRGFFINANSFSNYNFTPFSMASILNMNYLSGINDVNHITVNDYTSCSKLIKNNEVIRFLSRRNYKIVNYSIFDLAGHPSLTEYSLLPNKTKLITDQTLSSRFMRDVGWHFYTGALEIKWISKNTLYQSLNNDNKFMSLVNQESKLKADRPRFVYAHFEMPHPPFYYDSSLQQRSGQKLLAEIGGSSIESYKGYIPYVNKKMIGIIDAIKKNSNDGAVIIVMGDHGYRVKISGQSNEHYFRNLNAVYFPNKNYSLLNKGNSGVNQFRGILNSLFQQSFPLLKDSTVFLTDTVQ